MQYSPIAEQDDVVEEVEHFWGRLQQGDEGGQVEVVGGHPQELRHSVSGRAVQARADLVHQQHFLHAPGGNSKHASEARGCSANTKGWSALKLLLDFGWSSCAGLCRGLSKSNTHAQLMHLYLTAQSAGWPVVRAQLITQTTAAECNADRY